MNIITFTMEPLTPIRPAPRERKRLQAPNPEVRQRLMDAAADILREGGYAALRIEDIAERAGLSVGTFYLYFDGKPALFVRLVQDYTERLRQRLIGAGGSSSADRMARSIDAYLDFVLENERAFVHYVRASGSMQTNQGPLAAWALNSHAADLQPGVEDAVRRKEIRRLNPALTSQAIVGLIQHVAVYWLEHKDDCTREELKGFLLEFIGFGILRRPRSG